jgi:CheY-like chemotaxis protein
VFSATPDASGTVLCSSCGVRLRTRAPGAEAPAPRPVAAPRREMGPALARVDAGRAPAAAPAAEVRAAAEPALPDVLRQVLAEIRLVRETQERILGMLARQAGEPDAPADDFSSLFDRPASAAAAPAPAVRSGRRKSVLVIDDDDATREEAVRAFTAAEVPVRAVGEGHAAISAIAEERPDVVVLELGMGGSMGGKDVVNMIKATMEWVDIPIVLYTRVPVPSQKEARLVHGADDLVAKSPEGPSALVGRVIALFRRG